MPTSLCGATATADETTESVGRESPFATLSIDEVVSGEIGIYTPTSGTTTIVTGSF